MRFAELQRRKLITAGRFSRRGILNAGIVVLAACAISAPTLSEALDLDAVAGVYRKNFPSGLVSGESYRAQNILEIVKASPTSAYFRTRLEFFNGHTCAIWGIADVEGDALVYHGPSNVDGKSCVLTLKFTWDRVSFEDKDAGCRLGTCGMRGGYDGQAFESSTRRPIRYMRRVLESRQYRKAKGS